MEVWGSDSLAFHIILHSPTFRLFDHDHPDSPPDPPPPPMYYIQNLLALKSSRAGRGPKKCNFRTQLRAYTWLLLTQLRTHLTTRHLKLLN